MLRAFLCSLAFNAVLLTAASLVFAQEPSTADQQSVDAISHPENLEASLWAGSEQLSNPVAFTFDNHGRMYICETFRQSKGVEDNRSHMSWLDDDLAANTVADRLAYFKKHLKEDVVKYEAEEDRITVVADEDGDGVADKDWVFADGFNDILTGTGAGVLVHGNDVYYTCIPDVWKITDKDNDGLSDSQESLHYGYGVRVAFRGHDSHGLVIGPDGRLYFSIGDRGYNIQTKDGRDLVNPESGAVFRCELDGSGLEEFATGLRNPQELAFDDEGNLFTGDNNSDSGDEARWVHVVEGAEIGWRMAFQYLPDRGPWNREKLWHPRHEGQAAYIIPPILNFADGPSGLAYYPGTGLGDEYLGTFFLCDFRGDPSISGIRSFKMKPKGASYEMSEPRKFLWNVLATDVDFGPDGSLYTTDWIQGWEGVNRGRVVRISNPEEMKRPEVQELKALLAEDISEAPLRALRKRLQHADRRVRMHGQLEAARRGSVSLLASVATKSKHRLARLHGAWGLGHVARTTQTSKKKSRAIEALKPLLLQKDAALRAVAATTLGDLQAPTSVDGLIDLLDDESLRVQSLAAIALGKIGAAKSWEPLLAMISKNNDQDVVVRHAGAMGLFGVGSEEQLVGLASHSQRPVRLAAVLALRRMKSTGLSNFLRDQDPFIVLETARAIHDVPVYDAMPDLVQLVGDPTDSDPLMRRVLNACYRIGGAEQADAIAKVATAEKVSDVIRLEAIDMLRTWQAPSNRDRVLGMWRPLDSRSVEPAIAALTSLVTGEENLAKMSPEVAVAMVSASADLGINEAAAMISKMIHDDRIAAETRGDLLASLSKIDNFNLQPIVEKALDDGAPEVRSTARNLMLDIDEPRGLSELIAASDADSLVERQSAITKLGEIENEKADEAIRKLVGRLESVPVDTQLDVVEAAKQKGLTDELASFTKALEAKPYGEFHLATYGGNAARGEKVLNENIAVSCIRCHRVGKLGGGGRVGPNLAGIGKEKTAEYLLESIVDPNKKIAEGYGTLIVVTEDGLQLTGIVSKETDDLIHMIDADGNRFYVNKDEIILRKNGQSAMPEDLAKKLKPFELRDLVAYLTSLKTPYVEEAGHEE